MTSWIFFACVFCIISNHHPLVAQGKTAHQISHEDMKGIYEENLKPDFQPYHSSAYSISDLQRMLRSIQAGRPPKHMTLLVVKSNTVRPIPLTKSQPQLTTKRVRWASCLGACEADTHAIQSLKGVLPRRWDPQCFQARAQDPGK